MAEMSLKLVMASQRALPPGADQSMCPEFVRRVVFSLSDVTERLQQVETMMATIKTLGQETLLSRTQICWCGLVGPVLLPISNSP
jgi:hypothetical protein